MAEQMKDLKVTLVQAQWLKKACETQRHALVRSRGKEMVGSEIYALRTREIDALNELIVKL